MYDAHFTLSTLGDYAMSFRDFFKSREDLVNEGVATSYTAMGSDNNTPSDKMYLRAYYNSLPSKSAIRHDIQMIESEIESGWCEICGCVTECPHQNR